MPDDHGIPSNTTGLPPAALRNVTRPPSNVMYQYWPTAGRIRSVMPSIWNSCRRPGRRSIAPEFSSRTFRAVRSPAR
jgi:hypothetical protein